MVFLKHNSLKSEIFFNPIFIPCFSESMFFRVQIFEGPGFSGSRLFGVRVKVLEVAHLTNILELHIFENETAALLIIFFSLHGYTFWFFIFSKWKKHALLCIIQFKLKLQKQTALKLRVVNYAISFFSISYLCLF